MEKTKPSIDSAPSRRECSPEKPYQRWRMWGGFSTRQWERGRKVGGGGRGVMEAKRWVRNKTHTLVAHHQVRKTLREDKSTVSTENGIMGRFFCHIDTRASPERRMPAVRGGEGWVQEVRERVGVREHSKSISSTLGLQCFIDHTWKRHVYIEIENQTRGPSGQPSPRWRRRCFDKPHHCHDRTHTHICWSNLIKVMCVVMHTVTNNKIMVCHKNVSRRYKMRPMSI